MSGKTYDTEVFTKYLQERYIKTFILENSDLRIDSAAPLVGDFSAEMFSAALLDERPELR